MGPLTAPPAKASIRTVILTLFPWLARVGLSPTKALQVRSAVGRLELEGGGPAAARVGDVAGYEYHHVVVTGGNVTAVAIWRSAQNGAASSWLPVAQGPLPPVNGVTMGTPIAITTGSTKVQIG